MAKVDKYKWILNVNTPKVDEHSKVKLDIIERYLEIYLKYLSKGCRHTTLKLNIIDGFAGGGVYKCGTTGSPIRIKKAIETTKKIVAFERENSGCAPVSFNIDYRFIEKEKSTFDFLNYTLSEYGYLCNDTLCIQGKFIDHVDNLIAEVKNKGRSERSIFILDQYGYADAPIPVINKIFKNLRNTEVILTFSVDSLIDYISRQTPTILINMGLSKEDCERIFDVREDTDYSRSKIQPILYESIVKIVGAKYYTPFFIKSDVSNRAYWLFHFSSHPTARDEMMKLHWEHQNTFQHFGKPGLKMLIGFNSEYKDNLFNSFNFDDFAREKSLETLSEEIPRLLYEIKNTTYGDFKNNILNETPATDDMIKESLSFSIDSNDLEIVSKDGVKRQKYTTINDTDVIKWGKGKQSKLVF